MQKIKTVLELPVVQASDVAKIVLDITSINSAIKKILIDEIRQECADLCKKGNCTSVLRAGSKCFEDVKSFNWNMVFNELLKRAPNVADILAAIALPKPLKTAEVAQDCMPPFCLSWCILMNTMVYTIELSIAQKVITCILGVGGCNKEVYVDIYVITY